MYYYNKHNYGQRLCSHCVYHLKKTIKEKKKQHFYNAAKLLGQHAIKSIPPKKDNKR